MPSMGLRNIYVAFAAVAFEAAEWHSVSLLPPVVPQECYQIYQMSGIQTPLLPPIAIVVPCMQRIIADKHIHMLLLTALLFGNITQGTMGRICIIPDSTWNDFASVTIRPQMISNLNINQNGLRLHLITKEFIYRFVTLNKHNLSPWIWLIVA